MAEDATTREPGTQRASEAGGEADGDGERWWLPQRLEGPLQTVRDGANTVRVLTRAGLVAPVGPARIAAMVSAFRRWDMTLASAIAAGAARYPEAAVIVDDRGSLTYRELHERTNALANALAAMGVAEGDNVGVLCRNHRGFAEAVLAVGKLGANALLLNTSFAGSQLADVIERESAAALVYDREFSDVVAKAGDHPRLVADGEGEGGLPDRTVDEAIAGQPTDNPASPSKPGRQIILTSGTTGTPKGATRPNPSNLDPVVSFLSRIPLHAREPTVVSAPLFHAWGFAHFSLGLLLSSTFVLQRRFDPEKALAAIAEHRATTLVAVPVMLQRIMGLDEEVRRRYDTSSLRVVAVSGSALSGELATAFMDAFGDVVYNLYGSTEVAWAAIADPEDLRASPGTAGFPPRGTIVKVVDEDGKEVPAGQTGRIFVGNDLQFEGYTGGGSKEVLEGLMSSGDVGRFEESGRLMVEGRDDEMIVSGGENVFPLEVEDLLGAHPKVADVAVLGVEDERFGQALKAFVVCKDGADLSEDAVKAHVKENLAGYKVPKMVEFRDELPRNPAGKLLKRELAEPD